MPYQTVASAKSYADLAGRAARRLDETRWSGEMKRVNTLREHSGEAEIVQTLGSTDNVIGLVTIKPRGISGSAAAVRLTPKPFGSDRYIEGDRFVAALRQCA